MEIESFQDPNFNAIAWINSSFRNADGNQNKETFVTNLVSKLQLYVQQVNLALEGTSQQVLAALPKIMKDAQNLQHDATLMRTKMSEIQNNIAEVQKKTGACMGKIEQLDQLKTKLQQSKQGLQESDGWGHLTTELEDFLEHKNIEKACEKLQSLQKSLSAQIGLPGQSERQAQVEGFKNRIEALISPAVLESFTVGNIEQSKKHVQIYTIMDRFSHLTYYYRTVSKDTLQKQWNEMIELSKHNGSCAFFREFYDYLLEHWKKQQKWCGSVFEAAGTQEPTFVLIELLNRLDPSRETIIANCLKINNSKLKILEECSSATIYFGSVIQKQLSEVSTAKPAIEERKQLVSAIYDFFVTFVPVYASMEQNQLNGKLDEVQLIQMTAAESVRNFGNANSKLFKWSEESLRRCNSITQNVALPALITVFNQTFKSYMDKYKKAQRQLHSTRANDQNWSLVQSCVSLLQHIGNFIMQLEEFENFISDKMLLKEMEMQSNDYPITFSYKFIDKSDKTNFSKLIELIKTRKRQDFQAPDFLHSSSESIFDGVFKDVKPICEYIHDTLTSAVFQPIQHHLSVQPVCAMTSTNGSNLPDYSFAPQELITQIGQYLLTLPQHLEPLLLSPSQQLKTALKECDSNYTKNVSSLDILLSLIVDECCALYEEKIMQLSEIDTASAKQLATDIEYLGSVLEELGLTLAPRLHQISVLLRASPENYLIVSAGFNPVLVTSIRQIRNIVSVE